MSASDTVVPDTTASGRLVTYDEAFYEDLVHWKEADPRIAMRIVDLVEQVIVMPGEGIGKPKKIGGLDGLWSRRITRHHRLYYRVTNDELRFLRCNGHDLPQALWEGLKGASGVAQGQ